jgi:mono/diheme cytochrome c family protein
MGRIILAAALSFGLLFSGSAFAADGEKLFRDICAACHGVKGKGGPLAPALKGNEFLKTSTVDELKKLIQGGRQRKDKLYPEFPIEMPAHTQLTDEEVEAIIEHEKTHLLPE